MVKASSFLLCWSYWAIVTSHLMLLLVLNINFSNFVAILLSDNVVH